MICYWLTLIIGMSMQGAIDEYWNEVIDKWMAPPGATGQGKGPPPGRMAGWGMQTTLLIAKSLLLSLQMQIQTLYELQPSPIHYLSPILTNTHTHTCNCVNNGVIN